MDYKKLAISIGLCLLAGAIGSIFTFQSIPIWYSGLNKPSFTPPSWIFAPAWTALYLLMGISLYLVWQKTQKISKTFLLQLGLNVLWSIAFFGLRSPLYGLAVIIPLWFAIAVTIIEFNKTSRKAALLLLPYLAWVSFAAALNFFVWKLN